MSTISPTSTSTVSPYQTAAAAQVTKAALGALPGASSGSDQLFISADGQAALLAEETTLAANGNEAVATALSTPTQLPGVTPYLSTKLSLQASSTLNLLPGASSGGLPSSLLNATAKAAFMLAQSSLNTSADTDALSAAAVQNNGTSLAVTDLLA